VTFADVVRFLGLVLVVITLPLLVFADVTALECVVVVLVGIGLLSVPGP